MYVDSYLKRKYDIKTENIFLEERRKAIRASNLFLVKTLNGLNCHSGIDKYRGKAESECPLCQQTEDWLHVLKCCSTTPDKKRLIESIESIPTEEDFEIRLTEKILQQIREFFYSEHYNEHEVKLLFRGWIRKGEIKQRSKWVQKVIQVLVTFFHEV